MIDSHVHTHYSKHAEGSVEDIVIAAIANNIKILTITDHAPYPVDSNNRLLESELILYCDEIKEISKKYAKKIDVFVGLEVDFHPDKIDYIKSILQKVKIDFVIGAIHYIYIEGEKINVWDIDNLYNQPFISEYFNYLDALVESELFDTIAHPDTILRGGIESCVYQQHFFELIPKMLHYDISYELNCSGFRKSVYDPMNKTKSKKICVYPNKDVVDDFNKNGGTFTIGSDAHNPLDVGLGIKEQLIICKKNNIEFICYYKERQKVKVKVEKLLASINSK
jgi:histidinol-phosphatase (PHP family)